MKVLVRENFRYASGQVAAYQPITVYTRGTSDLVSLFQDEAATVPSSNPMATDSVGNLCFYLEDGSYDFVAFGVRVPFDAEPTEASYVHTQVTPAATWTIPHNMGSKPAVMLFLDANPEEPVWAEVTHPDLNTTVITLPESDSGKAYLR